MVHFVHIIWKRKGWMVAATTFGCCLISEIISEALTHDDTFYQKNPYPISIAFFVSSLLTLWLTFYLKAPDPKTGRDKWVQKDTLFFIPIFYWVWILCAISIVNLILRS